jgi:hypothetical protein
MIILKWSFSDSFQLVSGRKMGRKWVENDENKAKWG